MDNKSIAEQLVKRCLKKGADAAEVYIESGRSFRLDVRNGDIETVQEAASAGAGIRVFVQGRMAFASSNDLRETPPRRSHRPGHRLRQDHDGRPRTTSCRTTRTTIDVAGLYDPAIAKVPLEKKIELAKAVGSVGPEGPAHHQERRRKLSARARARSSSPTPTAFSRATSRRAAASASRSSPRRASRNPRAAIPAPAASSPTSRRPRRSRPRRPRKPCEMLDPRTVKTQKAAGHLRPRRRRGPARRHPGRGQRRARPAGRQLPRPRS